MKKSKWLWIGLLCLVLILAAVFGPGIYRAARMLGMVDGVWNQEAMSFDIQVKEAVELRLDWVETSQGRVFLLENSGVTVYFSSGAVYLENGKGYDFSQTAAEISRLLQEPWKLYPLVQTHRDGESWTAQIEKTDLTVTLEQGEPGFGAARVQYEDWNVEILPRTDREVRQVPETLLSAIASGETQGGTDMTQALLRLFAAWADLGSRETVAMELELWADCGPLALNDTLQVCTDRDTGIGYVEKNGYGLYFTDRGICTAGGKLVTSGESTVESAQMLGVAYLLLFNGDFTYRDGVYTLKLDQAGMEGFAYTIAPAAQGLNIAFGSGEVALTLKGDTLESLNVSCNGTLDLILTEAEVAIGAELNLVEGERLEIPQTVRQALE